MLAADGCGAAFAGYPLPMAVTPGALPADAEDNWPLRRLVERAGLRQLAPDPVIVPRLRGANTLDEWAALIRAAGWSESGD